MRNHLHFLSEMPPTKDVSWFCQRIKANIARLVRPMLDSQQIEALSLQTGLSRRTFWQRGFRSVVVDTMPMFWQNVGYIHGNPLRARLVREPEEYRWSSAALFADGKWNEEQGLGEVAEKWVEVLERWRERPNGGEVRPPQRGCGGMERVKARRHYARKRKAGQ